MLSSYNPSPNKIDKVQYTQRGNTKSKYLQHLDKFILRLLHHRQHFFQRLVNVIQLFYDFFHYIIPAFYCPCRFWGCHSRVLKPGGMMLNSMSLNALHYIGWKLAFCFSLFENFLHKYAKKTVQPPRWLDSNVRRY